MSAGPQDAVEVAIGTAAGCADADLVLRIDLIAMLDLGDHVLALAPLAAHVRLRHHDASPIDQCQKKRDAVGRKIGLERDDAARHQSIGFDPGSPPPNSLGNLAAADATTIPDNGLSSR